MMLQRAHFCQPHHATVASWHYILTCPSSSSFAPTPDTVRRLGLDDHPDTPPWIIESESVRGLSFDRDLSNIPVAPQSGQAGHFVRDGIEEVR